MPQIYSLESAITQFFTSNTSTTQQQCDERATSLIGSAIRPVNIQGAFSYTVAGVFSAKIVQFRVPNSQLNTSLLSLAKSIHGNTVADCSYHGDIGHPKPLMIYVMEKLPGVTYMEARLNWGQLSKTLSAEQFFKQKSTIGDIAQ